jgi:hypothetical protein
MGPTAVFTPGKVRALLIRGSAACFHSASRGGRGDLAQNRRNSAELWGALGFRE